MKKGMIKVGEAARMIGCSIDTLRANKQIPVSIAETGTRWYRRRDIEDYVNHKPEVTLIYFRFSPGTSDAEINGEIAKARVFCDEKRWKFEVVADKRSPANFDTDEFIDLLERIMRRDICRLVIVSPESISLIGHEIVLRLCEISSIDVEFLSETGYIDPNDILSTTKLLMNMQAGQERG